MVYDGITREQILNLAKKEANPAVTIYLPTARAGTDVTQGRIKLKNFLNQAENELATRGMRRTLAIDFLAEARELDFWNDRLDSVAFFIAPDLFEVFHLPFSCPEVMEVADHFNLRPLIPSLSWRIGYYVLALDKGNMRLLHCGARKAAEIDLENMPKSLRDFFAQDHGESGYQRYSAGGPGRAGSSITHGSGDHEVEEKEKTHLFMVAASQAVDAKLAGSLEPLVLAGTKDLQDEFRRLSKLHRVVPEGIKESPHMLTSAKLRELAAPIIHRYDDGERLKAIAHYEEMAGTGFTSRHIEEIMPAAEAGRVDVLFTQPDFTAWGHFDSSEGEAIVHPQPEDGDEDLVNGAAVSTIENGGTVYIVEPGDMNVEDALGAIFRY